MSWHAKHANNSLALKICTYIHTYIHIYIYIYTCSFGLGDATDELHESGPSEEFGDEECGVALGFGRLNPLKARPQHASFATTFAQHSASIATHDVLRWLLNDSNCFVVIN